MLRALYAKKQGFTLVELLVVIGIIGLLSTMAVSAVSAARAKAKEEKARADLRQIRTAIDMLAIDSNLWPGGQVVDAVACSAGANELEDLSVQEAGISQTNGSFSN